MIRCDNYPECGHLDGFPCGYVPDTDFMSTHAGCDHDAGYCQLYEAQSELAELDERDGWDGTRPGVFLPDGERWDDYDREYEGSG